jgi:hypothetical protein
VWLSVVNSRLDWQVFLDIMATVGENVDAQMLSKEISKLDVVLQGRVNIKPFFDDVHHDMIMKLPTEDGWAVLNKLISYVSRAQDASDLDNQLQMLCIRRWRRLCDLLMVVYNPKGYLQGEKLNMPGCLTAMPQWYKEKGDEFRMQSRQTDDHMKNTLATTWREGRGKETDVLAAHQLYPAPHEELIRKAMKRNRVGFEADCVQPGHCIPSPCDPVFMMRAQARDEPGLLAGSSARINLPKLIIGGSCESTHPTAYAWVPLRHRVEIDRVLSQMQLSMAFYSCEAFGSMGGCFKFNPWQHMNPYTIKVHTLKTKRGYQIGVTDFRDKQNKSTSGARLYVMGPAAEGELIEVLLTVGSLLSESDFDSGPAGFRCKLSDGMEVDWGMRVGHTEEDRDVKAMLELPDVAGSLKMEKQEIRDILEVALQKAKRWPNNSRVQETLAVWIVGVAKAAWQNEFDMTCDIALFDERDTSSGCQQHTQTCACGFDTAACGACGRGWAQQQIGDVESEKQGKSATGGDTTDSWCMC